MSTNKNLLYSTYTIAFASFINLILFFSPFLTIGTGNLAYGMANLKMSTVSPSISHQLGQCSFPSCSSQVHFDINTGHVFKYCEHHHKTQPAHADSSDEEGPIATAVPQVSSIKQPSTSQKNKCAIEDCPRPCHVDANGTVHECCGYTHAMEHIRRKMVERK